MMASHYVLPSLIPDEDEFDAGKMLAQLRKRSSSTSQVRENNDNAALTMAMRSSQTHKDFNNIIPSMRVSSRSSRSGSYSSRPPSSFRVFKADSDTTSNSSHAPAPPPIITSPSIRKRTSSLTLDAKTRANAASSHSHHLLLNQQQHNKALPSTPMSTTPSLTFSHSRTESRSDSSEAFASSSSPSRYSPEYRRQAIFDYTNSLDVLDQFEEDYAEFRDDDKFESISKNKIAYNDTFLSLADDDDDEDDESITKPTKKKTVAFKARNQRYPQTDKAMQFFGEDPYKSTAVTGQLNSQSTISLISPSKAGLKSLFSTITRGKSYRKDDFADSEEGHEAKERRKEATDYSSVRSSRKSTKMRIKTPPYDGAVDKGKSREMRSSETVRPKIQESVFYEEPKETSQRPAVQSIGSGTRSRLQRDISTDSVENISFIRTEEKTESPPKKAELESFLPSSTRVKKSQSIDALYAMLQPCLLEQQERERREQNDSAPSPVIEWPQMKPEKSMSLAEIEQRTHDLARRIEMRRVGTEQKVPVIVTEKKVSIAEIEVVAPTIISAPLQHKDVNVDLLPPLTSHLAQCLALDRKENMHPWKSDKERTRPLTASSPQSAVPKSWSGYVRAYAKGDFDLSNPPLPRSASLVNKAVPRSSPMVGAFSPSMSSTLGTNWATSPSGGRTRMASKESLHSLNDFYDLPGSYSSNILLPITPPTQQSLRERLPSPRFADLRKSRSREASQENMRLPRENEEDIRMQAEELAAVGGMGDIKGPRPVWEAERSASARNYLQDHNHQASLHLQDLIERLSKRLKVSYASVQILVADESIVLASRGLDEEALSGSISTSQVQGGSDDIKVLLRDDTLDAHAILQRDGAPLVIANLAKDWRFENRKSINLPFYAGVSLLASDTGLPIGTVSVMHHRAKEMTREEKDVLVETAREVERELQQMQSKALEKKLLQLDRQILEWVASLQTQTSQKETSTDKTITPPSSEALLTSRLQSALHTILSDLQIDFAYIARVGSDPLQCQMQVQQESVVYKTGEVDLDAALHLCALAAHKHGIHFDNDEVKLRQLLGEQVAKEDEAAGIPHFKSARIVACGLKEGGRAYRGTEGWVLGVASRGNGRLDAASGVYMMKFATLLAPMLLQGPGPRSSAWQRRREDSFGTPSREVQAQNPDTTGYVSAQSSPLPLVDQKLPVGPRRSRRKLPLASPPPGAPLPLPPVMAASVAPRSSTRKTILKSTSRGNLKQGLDKVDSDMMPIRSQMVDNDKMTIRNQMSDAFDNENASDRSNVLSTASSSASDNLITRMTLPTESSRGIFGQDLDIVERPTRADLSFTSSRRQGPDPSTTDASQVDRPPRRPRMMGGLRLDTT